MFQQCTTTTDEARIIIQQTWTRSDYSIQRTTHASNDHFGNRMYAIGGSWSRWSCGSCFSHWTCIGYIHIYHEFSLRMSYRHVMVSKNWYQSLSIQCYLLANRTTTCTCKRSYTTSIWCWCFIYCLDQSFKFSSWDFDRTTRYFDIVRKVLVMAETVVER